AGALVGTEAEEGGTAQMVVVGQLDKPDLCHEVGPDPLYPRHVFRRDTAARAQGCRARQVHERALVDVASPDLPEQVQADERHEPSPGLAREAQTAAIVVPDEQRIDAVQSPAVSA